MRSPRHSVLVRFLALSLAVALGAVVATAVIATFGTSEKLQGEFDQNTSQLEADGEILATLTGYASDHPTWSGVTSLVSKLADRTGRRIALIRPDGSVIADSARTLGTGPELPSVPAATIDARGNGIPTRASGAVNRVTKFQAVSKPFATATISGWSYLMPDWGLTTAELAERDRLAEKVAACYRRQGRSASVQSVQGQLPQVVLEMDGAVIDSAGGVSFGQAKPASPVKNDKCHQPALYEPSAKAKVVRADEVRRATACLDAAGERYKLVTEAGVVQVLPPDKTQTISETFGNCVAKAQSEALTPYVAPEARLYLGARSNFDVFSGAGMLRTAATALGVVLVAAVVMLFAGRRLVRPIVALTGAAQRMTNGDHAARVPVSGKDEVARLGHAFNAMADSIQQHDFQRKQLVSDVAHELRTPLANIKGYLVASEDGVVPLDGELVESLLEETGLLERLVADLQDLALADAGMLRMHPEPRDLGELAQQVVAAHRPAAESAGVRLRAEVTGPAPAQVDAARIRQALGNLVSNAIRFTPGGGQVLVGVRRVGGSYSLTVTDSGTGIEAEHLPHLFDRFYRADQSRTRATGGSGLGLAITKHLVEAHRGTITVTSTPDHGSTFTIRLPT